MRTNLKEASKGMLGKRSSAHLLESVTTTFRLLVRMLLPVGVLLPSETRGSLVRVTIVTRPLNCLNSSFSRL